MEQTLSTFHTSQKCLLSEYIKNSHFKQELLDTVREVFLRSNRFDSILISVEDESVLYLSGVILAKASKVEDNIEVDICDYNSWRDQIVNSFVFEYDQKRFSRSTKLETLRYKVKEHEHYSFVAHKLDENNNDTIQRYDFVRLDDEAKFILAIQQEITQSLEHDILTGGLNRAGLIRELQTKFDAIKPDEQYSIVCFNIQGFHLINELYGDEKGDKVLQFMYTTMVYSALKPVSYARLESDNFVCMIEREKLDFDVINQLCHLEYVDGALRIPFRSLCGVYHIVDPSESPVNACNHAKLAMTYIKDRYLQPWMVFENKMQSSYISDSEILKQLDDAIANNEFVPYFQPIVNTQSGRIEMAEALVRWISPTKGMISPGVFIPVLERHGGLSRIDMLMEQHIFDMQVDRHLKGLPMVPIDINLSWVDFSDHKLLDQLYRHIRDNSLPTDMMRYEITESALAEIAENRYDVLDFFKVQHVKLLIDDFGQAYSFGTMKDVDFTIIKIDKSMIDQIGSSRKVNLLIETMINMFHKMHAKVVAEGVETELQVEFLKQVGCDYIQGFRFFRPMDEKAFTDLLAHDAEAHAAALSESGAKVVKAGDAPQSMMKGSTRRSSKTNWRKAFSLKDFTSTFMILGICALLSATIYFSTYRLVYNLVNKSCDELTERDIDKIKLHIDRELSMAQEALQTFCTAVFRDGKNIPQSEEEIYVQMEEFLGNTPNLSGIVAGFEDSVFPQYAENLGFGPLVRHQGDSLVRYQVGEIRDFRKTKEWYSQAFIDKKARWTSPFFSEEGDIIIDYCIPLFDDNNEVIGVVACDLSISKLYQVIEDIKPYPTSLVMVMLEDLTFVIHPQKGYPMHKTLPVFLKERGIDGDPNNYQAFRNGERGKMVISPNGLDLFLYYDVIEKADYRLLIESSSSDVYSTLNDITSTMKTIGFGGLGLLILTLGVMMYNNKKRERRDVERNMQILRHSAEIDGLTDIFNRVTGEKMISEFLEQRVPGVMAILDCDKFKQVNDNYGHATGDKLLKQVSETLKTCFPTDIVLRLGGDEFAVYCRGVHTAADFEVRTQNFFGQVKNIRIEGMGNYSPSISMGAVVYQGNDDLSFDRIYTMADRLLYESKKTEGCALTISES